MVEVLLHVLLSLKLFSSLTNISIKLAALFFYIFNSAIILMFVWGLRILWLLISRLHVNQSTWNFELISISGDNSFYIIFVGSWSWGWIYVKGLSWVCPSLTWYFDIVTITRHYVWVSYERSQREDLCPPPLTSLPQNLFMVYIIRIDE